MRVVTVMRILRQLSFLLQLWLLVLGVVFRNKLLASYYFDTLPFHPQPERLESLTSYLMRIAEANGLRSMEALYSIVFPHTTISKYLPDYLPGDLEALSIATQCSESILVATTFHHLARKFSRSTSIHIISRFLSGSIASNLRYCPRCLASSSYRMLIWRFEMVPGCLDHHCRLVDHCHQCGKALPLVVNPPRICFCSFCAADLRIFETDKLTTDEYKLTYYMSHDLMFLFNPDPLGLDQNMPRYIGQVLAYKRYEKGYSREEVARRLGTTLIRIDALEGAHWRASLNEYFQYAYFLGMPLTEILLMAMSSKGSLGERMINDMWNKHRLDGSVN